VRAATLWLAVLVGIAIFAAMRGLVVGPPPGGPTSRD
jgi:hypothetical protein